MKHIKIISLLLFIFFYTTTSAQPGVIYTLSNGRWGDNILAYAHAALVAHQHNLSLHYTPFEYSNQLALHTRKKRAPLSVPKNKTIIISDGYLESVQPDTWYIVKYYNKFARLYDTMVQDISFAKKVKDDIAYTKKTPKIEFPSDCITVAVHVRKSGCKWDGYCKPNPNQFYTQKDLENAVGKTIPPKTYGDQFWPLKFPPDQYYVDQLIRLSELLGDPPLYIHLFTDYPNPQELVDQYEQHVNKPNITFSCRKKGNNHNSNVLEDFFAMAHQFDCLIRSGSNFGWAAQFIGDHKIIFAAQHAKWIGDILIVDRASVILRNGNTFKEISVEDVTQQDVKEQLNKMFLAKTNIPG